MPFSSSGMEKAFFYFEWVNAMKWNSFVAFMSIAAIPQLVCSQVTTYQYPFDVPTDPRSVAMGESFVAVRGNAAALEENPAGLAALTGLRTSYGHRTMDWISFFADFNYHAFSISAETPLGVFAASYARFTEGTQQVSSFPTAADPVMHQGEIESYQHAVVLGFGTSIMNRLEAGIEAKYFDDMHLVTGLPAGVSPVPSTTPAYLFDVGLLYTVSGISDQVGSADALTFGASVQNIGTKLIYSGTSYSLQQAYAQPLPSYFRLGVSYSYTMLPNGIHRLSPFQALITAEYRNTLNLDSQQDQGRAFWGSGLECTLFEVISLRGGGVVMPFTSVYGRREKVAYRYGAEIHFPLEKLGIPAPLIVSAGYSAIPLVKLDVSSVFPMDRVTFDVFSFEVRSTVGLW